ncbi:hypothetical protein [Algoriphagus sp. AK58]|uniref:hypothetical protein n=1 Tax=Algoriphagus sp. AK58 TaxID=1406877 RepID=UPI00164F835D|nr:hypothetical protein [Algoriphagus sp. AK58]MBC6367432.1 hypothetical protein [Algoriphagus sp. AK58]
MKGNRNFKRLIVVLSLGVFLTLPINFGYAFAQQNLEASEPPIALVHFNKLTLKNKTSDMPAALEFSAPQDLNVESLTVIEENIARNLNSHWVWPEYTLEMMDSYSPFLFRTKKSQEVDEVRLLVQVNSRGRVSGFEVIGDVDKGLKERLDHMIRKLPDCKPVPGFASYSPATFEVVIQK